MKFVDPKNKIVQTIAVLLPLLALFLFMLYNSCAISGFCKKYAPSMKKNEKLLFYLRNLDSSEIKKIEFYLYMHSCVLGSDYLNFDHKIKTIDFTKDKQFKSFINSLNDLSSYQPSHQLLRSLVYIKVELNNGYYMNLDLSRKPLNENIAYIHFRASSEIEDLEGFKIFPHSFKFKSSLLYDWIKEQINEMKEDIKCCDCQLSSGKLEPSREKRGIKDEPCYLCIM